jgi:hypothetical protein
MAPLELVFGAYCLSDGRIAPTQRNLQPRPQPEEDKNKRLGDLGRLLGDHARQPAVLKPCSRGLYGVTLGPSILLSLT